MAEQTLTVDGKQYLVKDLSDDARARIASVRACDQRIQQLQQEVAITQTARAVYVNALKEVLPEPVGDAGESADADGEAATVAAE